MNTNRTKFPTKSKLNRPNPVEGSTALENSISHMSGGILSPAQKKAVISQLASPKHLSQIELEGSGWNPHIRDAIRKHVEELQAEGFVKQAEDERGRPLGYQLDVEE
jgi:hypothetical protein